MTSIETPTENPTRPAIARVQGLKVHFASKKGPVHAVDGVDFDIADGEMLGLVGETGCGKSVTGRAFLGLIPQPPARIAGGRILFRPRRREDTSEDTPEFRPCPTCKGADIVCATCNGSGYDTLDLLAVKPRTMRAIRGRRIAMIFQDPGKALNPILTIGDQLAEVFLQHASADLLADIGGTGDMGGLAAGAVGRAARQESGRLDGILSRVPPVRGHLRRLRAALEDRIAAALAETQISNPRRVIRSYPHELSGGMRQRVMIAQALACDPDLIIADEPTTALDVTIQAKIMELIKMLQEKRKTSVLYISHDLSLVRRTCDRVVVMYAGRVAEVGGVREVFAAPRHPYTRGLLDAIPRSGETRGVLASIPGTVPELVSPPPGCRFADRCVHVMPECTRVNPTLQPLTPDQSVSCFLAHPPAPGAAHKEPELQET
ncbi:ABC transporter ATP-binding protein [Roseisalinus antarcticus]|uniref:Oligopeptide transport ATP-binding protein OppD n=1 Tax=Roseisalinus antarcticus TaxID=254357 RepID=A0A1Y5RMQ1_9RHOB|nr:ABC transporter ATP-binding protein [Roseisalinus antarcticus]SLN21113.1 Oligopeptide transport ATP-binding protein OppD [Roseisalinus antarcticus]